MRPESLIYTRQCGDEHPRPFHIQWEYPQAGHVSVRLVFITIMSATCLTKKSLKEIQIREVL